MAVELHLVEGRRVIQDRGGGRGCQLLPQLLDALAERKMQSQLDQADQVASAPAAMAIEQILARVDVERGSCFPMERTRPHQLVPRAGTSTAPVALLEVIQ